VRLERRPAFDVADLVAEERQVAGGGDPRVLLPERAGGGVAGVGEAALPRLLLAAVELLERRQGHVHLTAHLEHAGRRTFEGVEDEVVRDGLDRAHVAGEILANPPVTPGRAPHQAAVLVQEAHRHPVDLELADQPEVRHVADQPFEPPPPRIQLLAREGVVQ